MGQPHSGASGYKKFPLKRQSDVATGIFFYGSLQIPLMTKSLSPTLKPNPDRILSSIRSPWVLVFFLLPLAVYFISRIYENELTSLIIPLFPIEADKSFGFYKDFVRLCFNEMLWLSFFLLLVWAFYVYGRGPDSLHAIENHVVHRAAFYSGVIVSLGFLGAILIAYYTLHDFPNSGDEYVYLYQAETLSEGRLWNEAHALPQFFSYSHLPQKDGMSVGRFPPGWPLLLSLPFVFHIPPLWLNPVIAAITLWIFYSFGCRYYGHRVALWALISVAFTSFYLLNSASFFSHNACLLMAVGFIYSLYLRLEKGSTSFALLAGVCLGAMVITRYYNAVLIAIPVFIYLFYQYRWKCIPTLFLIGVGSLPFFIFLFWYNYSITGNGLLPVTVWADPRERLGFGVRGYTPIEGIEHFIRRVFLFLYWSSPALLLLYVVFLFQKVRSRVQRFFHPEDYYLLMLILGYYFYHHIGGNQYGPRFWFEGTPFLTLFVVKKTFDTKAKWVWALFAAGLIYGIVKIPYIIHREHRVIEERMDIYTKVKESKISNAVVLVATHTGIIRPMGELDLTRNGMDHNSSVIYAHDLGERNQELMKFYPDRAFYKYVRDPEIVEGKLVRIK